MKLIDINWNASDRQLRQFGSICFVVLPLLGWIWGASASIVGWLAAIGLTIGVVSMVVPQTLRPLFIVLTIVATPIGMVVGELAMLLIYVAVFFPMGMIFWMFRRDSLQRKLDRASKTYWQSKKQPKDASSYYHQW